MEGIYEMEYDENTFECSECEFKSFSESEVKDHSVIHTCSETKQSHEYKCELIKQSELYLEDKHGSMHNSKLYIRNKYESMNQSEACITSQTIYGNVYQENHTHKVKIESTYNDKFYENKDWFKEIKCEDVEIEHPQITDYINIQQDTPSKGFRRIKIENTYFTKEIHTYSGKQNINDVNIKMDFQDMNFFTEERMSLASINRPAALNFKDERVRKPRKQNVKDLKNCSESDEIYFENLFVVKKVQYSTSKSFDLIICKICNFSCREIKDSKNHARIHSKELASTFIAKSIIVTNFEFFVCLKCHKRIINIDQIYIHMQSHKVEQFSNSIVAVKFINISESTPQVLHCCEICPFACSNYLTIFLHVRDHHTPAEVDVIDKAKYHEIVNSGVKENVCEIISKEGLANVSHCGGPRIWLKQPNIEVEIDHTGKYIPDGWQRKVLHMKKGYKRSLYRIFYISPFGVFSGDKLHVGEHIKQLEGKGIMLPVNIDELDFKISSQNLLNKAHENKRKCDNVISSREEVEVDNTNIYVPEGWQRRLFRYKTGPKKDRHFICYFSPCNIEVNGRVSMRQLLKSLEIDGCTFDIDVQKLNFQVPSCNAYPNNLYTTSIVEIEVNNNEKYVPEGWQRKVCKITNGKKTGKYLVRFITPSGKLMYSKAKILKYIQRSENNALIQSIDVEEMDFTTSSHNLPKEVINCKTVCIKQECVGCHKKGCSGEKSFKIKPSHRYCIKQECVGCHKKGCGGKKSFKIKPSLRKELSIELDNTDIYVPEGWKRELYTYIKGTNKGYRKICYVSPFDTVITGPKKMKDYLASLEKKGTAYAMNIQKLNFKLPASLLRKKCIYDKNKSVN